MSTQELPIDSTSLLGTSTPATGVWPRIGGALETAGEWLNPLLVKEVRQALKSRQFSLTFALVLATAWIWTFFGISRLGPNVAYRPDGVEMFYGYYMILSFPMLLMVPYSAFRSLIAEREDNTYELVAITNQRPRQIVSGKLGSATAQMLVYLSAVAPCLAFTYLLHGIDVLTICWIIFWTFLASLGFSLFALLLATVAKEKHWQVACSVVIIVGYFWAFVGALNICYNLLRSSHLRFQDADLWIGTLTFLSFYASTFALVYLAAAAQLTFTAENRSTPLRITMLVQFMLIAGWMGFEIFRSLTLRGAQAWLPGSQGAGFYGVATAYWWAMGAFMTGESPDLSPRVKRRLPTSFLGRVFFTLFNPGPGTGYLYAISNITAAGLLGLIGVAYTLSQGAPAPGGFPSGGQMVTVMLLIWCYPVIYLGMTSLFLRLLRRFMVVTLATAVPLNIILVLAGWGVPWTLDPYSVDQSRYNLIHVSDPFWSCLSVVHPSTVNAYGDVLLVIIVPTAIVVLLLNLVYIIPEIRHVRIALPQRVEEEKTLAAIQVPPAPVPASPWD